MSLHLLIVFLFSFGAAVGIAPFVIALFRRKNWLDDPAQTDHPKVVHTKPLPRGGGLVVGIAILLSMVIFLPIEKYSLGILAGLSIIMIIGFLDDIHNLSPFLRLPFLLIPALCVVGAGVGIAYVSNPFGPGVISLAQPQLPVFLLGKWRFIWILADLLALGWIMWCMTIVNWSKGLDGQMPGFVGIAALVIAILSLRFSSDPVQQHVTLLALIVSGAFFGFLLWNKYPQKMMAGYGASTMAGFLLAVLSILSGAKVATAMLVLAVPSIDAVFVILRRLAQRKSPFMGDRGHLHHKLMDLGWGKRRIAGFYWGTTAILGLIALQLNSQQKLYTIVALFLLFGGFVTWFTFFISSSRRRDPANG